MWFFFATLRAMPIFQPYHGMHAISGSGGEQCDISLRCTKHHCISWCGMLCKISFTGLKKWTNNKCKVDYVQYKQVFGPHACIKILRMYQDSTITTSERHDDRIIALMPTH